MATIKDLRTRIKSVKNTQKITRAMKLVAAAKLRRAQEAAEASRPYAEKMREVLATLSASVEEEDNDLFRSEDAPKTCLLVMVSSDRGLCGAFNSQLFRRAQSFINANKDSYEQIVVTAIGRKGREWISREGVETLDSFPVIDADPSVENAGNVADIAVDGFRAEDFDRVYFLYNEFQSAIAQVPHVAQLLPIDPAGLSGAAADEDDEGGTPDYIYEPGQEELLNVLLPQFIQSQVYRAFLESQASEQGARMTAMDNATNNANDLIDSLTLQMNRARQAAITTELMEITAGAEAIK